MNKLEKKLIECLNFRSLKQDFARMQKWDDAAKTREIERRCALDFYNLFNETSVDDFDWMTYDLCIKDYCISEYGTDDTKCILRVEKLKQLGI